MSIPLRFPYLNSDKTFVYEFEDSKYVGSLKIRDLNEDYITGLQKNISIEFSEESSSDCKFTYENFSSSLVHIRLDAVEPLLGPLDEFVCEAKVTVTRLDTNESAKTAVSVLVKK